MKRSNSLISKLTILLFVVAMLFSNIPVSNVVYSDENDDSDIVDVNQEDVVEQEDVILDEDEQTIEIIEENIEDDNFDNTQKDDLLVEEEQGDRIDESYETNARTVANLSNVTYRTQDQIRSYYNSHKFYYWPADYSSNFKTSAPYDVGDQGQLTTTVLNDALNTLNVMRYIAGMGEVTLNSTYGAGAQAGAFLNYLNDDLSHNPPKPSGVSNALYTLGKDNGTAKSNICQGSGNLARSVINAWMADYDDYNIDALGHRRWCLHPKMSQTGFGQVGSYTAMYAFDKGVSNPSTKISMWPAQNMPTEFFEDYYPWSYSTGQNENVNNVVVTLLNLNTNVSYRFSASSSSGDFYVNNQGYGLSGCIIFRPNNITYKAGDSFKVTITGLVGGTVTYQVDFFDMITNPITEINGDDIYVAKGKSIASGITFVPSNHNDYVTYTSNNTSIATVNQSGTVTGVNVGNTSIYVRTWSPKISGSSFSVRVYNPMTSLTLDKTSITIYTDNTETLKANVVPLSGTLQDKLVWSSSNTSVATVTSSGVVKGVGPGTATITVRNPIENKSATCTVTVKQLVTSVSISPSSKTLGVGETYTLRPTVKPDNATNPAVSYSSSNTTIATVSSSGVITAKAIGSATITITAKDGSNKSATFSVTVGKAIESITLSPTTLNIKEGTTRNIYVTYNPDDAVNKGITWTSSNTSVATISTGTTYALLTAVSPGTTTITAKTKNGKTATCSVTVYKTLSSISITPSSATLASGETKQLTVVYYPSDAGNKEVTWTTSKGNVASISSTGLVTAKAGGTAVITAKSKENSDIVATCTINVTQLPTSVTLNKSSLTFETIGSSETLLATVNPSTATNQSVTWTSDNTSIATVSSNGLVTAKGYGTTVITVKTVNDYTAKCTVRVGLPLQSITLNKTTTSIKKGDSETLTATLNPNNTYSRNITWSSSKPSVATVDQNGKVTAVEGGTATISASCGSYTARCNVTVIVPVTSIIASDIDVIRGRNKNITVSVLPENATNPGFYYEIEDTSIATVSSYGNIYGISLGTTYLTITSRDGYGAQTRVAVNVRQPVQSMNLNKSSLTIVTGSSEQLIATVLPETAFDKTIEWTSSNEQVATVDQNGLVTGIAIGEAVIKAKSTSSGYYKNCAVYVKQPVESITLNKTYVSLYVTEVTTLNATVLPSNAYNTAVEWTSSNTSVATVDQNGRVTAVSKGTATITAKSKDGSNIKATCTINVIRLVSQINLNKTSLTLNKGNSETLTYTALPADANNKQVTWKSFDTSIATVDQNGKITAVEGGTVTIMASAKDGGGANAICQVTVNVPVTQINIKEPFTIDKWKTESFTLTIEVLPENATNKAVEIISSNTNVVTVDENGVLNCVGVGSSIITIKAKDGSGVQTQKTVNVYQGIEQIILDKTSLFLMEGESYTFNPTILPQGYSTTLLWTSSDYSIVSNFQNVITAHKPGVVTIKAESILGPKAEATCIVTVGTRVTNIVVSSISKTMDVSQTYRFYATAYPLDATNRTLQWSSSNEDVATVDENGNVTALAVGKATIYVSSTDGSNIVKEISITVKQKVTNITLNKSTLNLFKQDTYTLTATVLPDSASDKSVTWSSSNTAVATVSSNGSITAVNKGTATITATANDGSGISASCTVNVSIKASSITVKPEGVNVMFVGQQLQLEAKVSPDDTTNKKVTWSSSNPELATVDQNGLVTAKKADSDQLVRIYAYTTDGSNLNAYTSVKVNQQITSIELDYADIFMYKNQNRNLTATVYPENASNKELYWYSSDTSIATVDQNGKVTGLKNGVATITVSATDGSDVKASCKVTVGTIIEKVTLSEYSKTLSVDQKYTFQATVYPENATNQTLEWTTSDHKVATVNLKGEVTAVSCGNATIFVKTTDGSKIIERINITVIQKANSISLNMTSLELYQDDSITLYATILPESTSNKKVNWFSSKPDIATVDSNGVVVAKAIGETTIIVSTTDGSLKTATCKIIVKEKPVLISQLTLHTTNMTINRGQQEKLDVTILPNNASNKTLTWKSSNSSIASVDNSGNIKGLKVGQAFITVSTTDGSNLSKTCIVNVESNGVQLDTPQLKSIFNVKNGIDVRFAEVEDATSYIFIRISNGVETTVAEVNKDDIPEKYGYKNWTDTSVKSEYGKGFAYKVIAKNDEGESDPSDQLAIFRLNEPTITKLESTSDSIRITWNKEKVHRYVLQYSADGENWTTIETTATSRNITGLDSNTTYYFRVRGVMVQKDDTIHYSQYSTRKTCSTY